MHVVTCDLRDSLVYLKCGCMRYLFIVSVLPTVDGGWLYFHCFTLQSDGPFQKETEAVISVSKAASLENI